VIFLIVVVVNLRNFLLYLLSRVLQPLLHPLTWSILMYGVHHQFLPKVDLDICIICWWSYSLLLGLSYETSLWIFLIFTIYFVLWLKLNIILLLSVFVVICMVSTLLINFVNYLLLMVLFITLLVLTLLNRMELLKENIVLLSKLPFLFYCLPQLQVSFGGETILIVVHAIDRIPSSVTLGVSPFQKLYGYVLDYSSLKVFGSSCFVLRPQVEHSNLSSHLSICVFLGHCFPLSQPTLRRGCEKAKIIGQSVCLQGRKRVESPPTFIRGKR